MRTPSHTRSSVASILKPKEALTGLTEWLDVDLIDDNPYQTRSEYPKSDMDDMKASIREHGQIQAIIVRPKGGRYEAAIGHRRKLAVKTGGAEGVNAGITQPNPLDYIGKIRCEVRDLDEIEMAVYALEENEARSDVAPLDKANGYKRLRDLTSKEMAGREMSWAEVAKRSKLTYRQVHRVVQLLELPDNIQKALTEGKILARHGHALHLLQEWPDEQTKMFRQVVKEKLSGTATETLATVRRDELKEADGTATPKKPRKARDIQETGQGAAPLAFVADPVEDELRPAVEKLRAVTKEMHDKTPLSPDQEARAEALLKRLQGAATELSNTLDFSRKLRAIDEAAA